MPWVTLPPGLESPRTARAFVQTWLDAWGLEHLAPAAALVTSELATNAALHTGLEFDVGIESQRDAVRIAVRDRVEVAGAELAARDAEPDETHGRGLSIVNVVCTDWGSTPRPDGKEVWCELPSTPSGGSTSGARW